MLQQKLKKLFTIAYITYLVLVLISILTNNTDLTMLSISFASVEIKLPILVIFNRIKATNK